MKITMIDDYKCEICGNRSLSHKYRGKDRFYGVEGLFDILRCDGCGLLSIVPRPSPEVLKRYYPDNYYSYNDTERIMPKMQSLKAKVFF